MDIDRHGILFSWGECHQGVRGKKSPQKLIMFFVVIQRLIGAALARLKSQDSRVKTQESRLKSQDSLKSQESQPAQYE